MSKKWLNNNNMLPSEMSSSTSSTPTKLSNTNSYSHHHYQQQQQQQQQQHGSMGHNNSEYVIDYFVDGNEKNNGGGSSGNGSMAIGNADQGSTTMADFPIGTFSMDDEYGRMLTLLPTGKEIHSSAVAAAAALNNKNMTTTMTEQATATISGSNGGNNNSSSSSSSNNGAGGVRETGIIEKLLHSYGFIQCCERQARLFFHFSQFSGNLEHLKIGDPVEFEMTYDRRTGKPIASFVSKISPEAVAREERVTGSVTIEPELGPNGELSQLGRISYENRGECFFLPFGPDDVEGTNVRLTIGDKVSFQIATNNKGNLGAQNIRLENAMYPIKYRGIINSIKDHFGFIERADVVKEIFFHFSEIQIQQPDTIVTASVGDHVEFTIQTRNGKEIACNIEKLPNGSVILEDISEEIMKGQVLKPIDRREVLMMLQREQQNQNNLLTDPIVSPVYQTETVPMMYENSAGGGSGGGGNSSNNVILLANYTREIAQPQGRIRYRSLVDHAETEITFGYRDQVGDFTLKHGDWVRFRICNDRRDQLKRAKMIELMPECSFNVSGEKRECGIVDKLCDCYGFLRCAERDHRVFFHFSELLEPHFGEPKLNDEFEFTAINADLAMQSLNGSNGSSSSSSSSSSHLKQKFNAIRLRKLELGSVQFEIVLRTNLRGIIAKDIFHNRLLSDDGNNLVMNGSSDDSNGAVAGTAVVNHSFATTFDHIYSGLISYMNENGSRSMITFYLKDCDSRNALPQVGDTVDFNLSQVKATKEIIATSVQIVSTAAAVEQVANALAMSPSLVPQQQQQQQSLPQVSQPSSSGSENFAQQSQLPIGFVTQTFKENFGFIETFNQRDEIFFHYSHFDGDITKLKAGVPVQYLLSVNIERGFTASYVSFLNDTENVLLPHVINTDRKFKGIVQRALRHFNSDQNEYSGLVEIIDLLPQSASSSSSSANTIGQETNHDSDENNIDGNSMESQIGLVYHYGLMSLLNKSDIIQVGDCVQFNLDTENRVANLCILKNWLKSTVDAIKGDFGFLTHEIQDGRKLFFHMSEVAGTDNGNTITPNDSKNNVELKVGDTVKFFIVKNHRTGKFSAHGIIKIEKKHERPERLINRLRQISIGNDNCTGPKVSIIRQPRGPDNTKGFALNARLRHGL